LRRRRQLRVFLYNPGLALQPERVRVRLWVVVFQFPMISASAQEQERKLVDRLLKPDTTLANSQQNRRFSPASSARTNSSTTSTTSFYIAEKNLTRNFATDRRFATTSYLARNFATKGVTPPAARASRTFSTRGMPEAASKANASNRFSTREFAGERSFRAHGKSQKALDAQHHSLTIEEVRELLNKNK
jgi:hypothetical protein